MAGRYHAGASRKSFDVVAEWDCFVRTERDRQRAELRQTRGLTGSR